MKWWILSFPFFVKLDTLFLYWLAIFKPRDIYISFESAARDKQDGIKNIF